MNPNQKISLGFFSSHLKLFKIRLELKQLKDMGKHPTPKWPSPFNKKICICIPVYNGAKYISATIDSILNQDHQDFEIFLVDDHSNDDSFKVITEISKKDHRVKVYQTPKNLGYASKVLNYIIPELEGDYFLYSSQDDLFSKDWLSSLVDQSISHKADAVIANVTPFHETHIEKPVIRFKTSNTTTLKGYQAAYLSMNWRVPGNALWNMSLIKSLGFSDFNVFADEYSVRRFFLHCNTVAFSKGIFYYRQDNSNAITKSKNQKSFDLPITQLEVYRLFEIYGLPKKFNQANLEKANWFMQGLQSWFQTEKHKLEKSEVEKIEEKIRSFFLLQKNLVKLKGTND